MSYVGIDPSLSGCGVVVISDKGKILSSATIKSKAATAPLDRATRYKKMVDQIVLMLTPGDVIRIEGYSFGSQGRAITSLAEFRSALLSRLDFFATDVEEVPPKSLKKFFTGNGNASKEDMIEEAGLRGMDCTGSNGKPDDNLADAYALGIWGLHGKQTEPKPAKKRKKRE